MDLDKEPVPSSSVQTNQNLNKAAAPQAEERRHTEDEETYMSAKESFGSKGPSHDDLRKAESASKEQGEDITMTEAHTSTQHQPKAPAQEQTASGAKGKAPTKVVPNDEMEGVETATPSDGSSPPKPLLRKSSLTFSALPGREPLVGKKTSFGAQTQRTSVVDQFKAVLSRSSYLGRFTGGKSLGGQQNVPTVAADKVEDWMDVDTVADKPPLQREESETTRLHNKTSTQRLHDRINMLGKTKEVRSSKSIPNLYAQLPAGQESKSELVKAPSVAAKSNTIPGSFIQSHEDEDDDWIAPMKGDNSEAPASRPPLMKSYTAEAMEQIHGKDSIGGLERDIQQSPARVPSPNRRGIFGHKKTTSTTALPSPTRAEMAPDPPQKPISVSNPNPSVESFTPVGSPKRMGDGPLSASKAKLYSVLKSAKGIFASSAGVSAQAKMEALSPPPPLKYSASVETLPSPRPDIIPAPALYPTLQPPKSVSSEQEGRRTRSSSEREQKRKEEEAKQRQKVTNQLEKAREKERQVAAAASKKMDRPDSPAKRAKAEAERSKETLVSSVDDMPPPPPPKSNLPTAQQTKLREPRRVGKPVQAAPAPKAKPAPVTVRMPSQRIGHMPPNNTALASSLSESLAPPVPPKQPSIVSKPSNASLHSSASTTSLKGTASSQSARRAMEAAAKKKEQEEKAAQRKAEQKRELEQKRQAKQEAERRLEQARKAAEQQRIQEAKQAAQRQVAEAKRLEQQRKDVQRPPSREQNDLATTLQQERAHAPQPAHPRADVGNARPLTKMPLVQDPQRPAVQINPAKPPAKRPLQPDPEEDRQRPQIQRNPASYQQMDSKRRKTEEDESEPVDQRRSVMAPPIRQSNIRKVWQSSSGGMEGITNRIQEPSKFPMGYMQQASHGQQHQQSMYIKTVTAQHHQHHAKQGTQQDMAKFANARIPFADAPNPPAGPSAQNGQGIFKTPGRPDPNFVSKSAAKSGAKSSPYYPPGETIALPEIATDSEDEDSENEFQAPSWVDSPALRELLQQQQLVDPENVFGPIAPLHMEEVFRNKDRHKKFRERTSSAVWTHDRVTEEERRKDREARERFIKDGGWTFHPNS